MKNKEGFIQRDLNNAGFTLIELIVVSGLLIIIIAVAVNAFFSTLRGSARTVVTNEVKASGDYAISVMERMIRSAQSIDNSGGTLCDGSTLTSLTITNANNRQTTFSCPPNSDNTVKFASVSAVFGPLPREVTFLTSDTVRISNCFFTCTQPLGGAKVITIKFIIYNLTAPGVTLRPEEYISLDFKTSVLVRNTGED